MGVQNRFKCLFYFYKKKREIEMCLSKYLHFKYAASLNKVEGNNIL